MLCSRWQNLSGLGKNRMGFHEKEGGAGIGTLVPAATCILSAAQITVRGDIFLPGYAG